MRDQPRSPDGKLYEYEELPKEISTYWAPKHLERWGIKEPEPLRALTVQDFVDFMRYLVQRRKS